MLTIHDFLRFTHAFGVDLAEALPITIVRAWHLQLALMWISACWVGASIFVLSTALRERRPGGLARVNLLFGLVVVWVAGTLVGIALGPKGLLGEYWNLLGNQGWEFVELGKLWQGVLFVVFVLWAAIVWRRRARRVAARATPGPCPSGCCTPWPASRCCSSRASWRSPRPTSSLPTSGAGR
ncbi:MAG: hypothetical protein V9G12_09880 [Microthrixaceae bacterium]